MPFLASVGCAGPSLFTAEAVEEEPTNHLNANFHFYLPKRRKNSLLGYAEYCPKTEHDYSLEAIESHQAIIPALKSNGEIWYNHKHWSQRGPGDLGAQKSSEEGLEGDAMVFFF